VEDPELPFCRLRHRENDQENCGEKNKTLNRLNQLSCKK
jgi:hypothetical protein